MINLLKIKKIINITIGIINYNSILYLIFFHGMVSTTYRSKFVGHNNKKGWKTQVGIEYISSV